MKALVAALLVAALTAHAADPSDAPALPCPALPDAEGGSLALAVGCVTVTRPGRFLSADQFAALDAQFQSLQAGAAAKDAENKNLRASVDSLAAGASINIEVVAIAVVLSLAAGAAAGALLKK